MNYRKDFPIFNKIPKPFVYFDSAATAQKPRSVIQAELDWYEQTNANVHRGSYALADQATDIYELTRSLVANFINAPEPDNLIYTRGTTEAINLVAATWGRQNLKRGDAILLTEMEHHANLVPWQMLAEEKGLRLKFWPIDQRGKLIPSAWPKLLKNTRLISLTHASNVLGTINPIGSIIRKAHQHKIPVLIDAAQSVPHLPIDIKRLDPDWLAFSSHKMLGPTGLGILYVKSERFSEMSPYQGGGEMIEEVNWRHSTYNQPPWKFEAGTQALAQVAGLGAAVRYLQKVGLGTIRKHDLSLVTYAYRQLQQMAQVTIYGPSPAERTGLISFTVRGIHAHDLGTLLNDYGIAVRVGHHCCQPLHRKLGLPATARISFYLYNNRNEIDYFIKSLKKIIDQWTAHTT